jgi:PLD-like domain
MRAPLSLDQAIQDKAQVRVIAYDFNLPGIVDRLEKLGSSLKIIIDDSKGHGGPSTAETEAEHRLVVSAGRANVLRQHMGDLQHNKTIAVKGATVQKVVCGSTNLSWRGFYVQSNNAFVLTGATAVDLFFTAFDNYFNDDKNSVADFADKSSANWNNLGLPGIDAKVAFSPHSAANAKLDEIANDLKSATLVIALFPRISLRIPRSGARRYQGRHERQEYLCLWDFRQEGWRTGRARSERKRRSRLRSPTEWGGAGAFQIRAKWRRWDPHASQVYAD